MGDAIIAKDIEAPFRLDTDDEIFQVASSSDYAPTPGLKNITAPVLTINSADDERNPMETGLMESGLKHARDAHLLLIPASAQTYGHGTVGYARRTSLRRSWDQPPEHEKSAPHPPQLDPRKGRDNPPSRPN